MSGEAVFFDRIRMISHFGLTEQARGGGGGHARRSAQRLSRPFMPPTPLTPPSFPPPRAQYLNRFRYCVGPGRGPSYRPSVDLVVPDTMEMPDKMLTPFGYTATGATPPHARTMRFFFAGSRTGPWRERLFDRHGGQEKKGIHLYSSLVSLGEKMRKAQFCADVGAAGFSTRFTLAVVSGCVPLYLKELAQPWDGVLDHSAFSIGLTPDEYITNLTAVLDAVTPERLAQLQAGVAAVRLRRAARGAARPLRAALSLGLTPAPAHPHPHAQVWRRFVWSSFSTWGGPGGPCSGLPCSGPVADEGPDGDAYDLLMARRESRGGGAALRGRRERQAEDSSLCFNPSLSF